MGIMSGGEKKRLTPISESVVVLSQSRESGNEEREKVATDPYYFLKRQPMMFFCIKTDI